MKHILRDKFRFLKSDILDFIQAFFVVILTPFCFIYHTLLIIIHPILWTATFFQCKFIWKFYVLNEYHNLEEKVLIRYSTNLDKPVRSTDTLRNKIYRWCTHRIFKRNNYSKDKADFKPK